MPNETLKQVVDRVTAAKTAIGNAIVAKGGTVAAGDGLEEFAADIATIPGGAKIIDTPVAFRLITNIEELYVPSGVTSLGYAAAQNATALKKIVIPDTVTTMANYVCDGCTSLVDVTLSANTQKITYNNFSNCTALESITIPASVTEIYGTAFSNDTALTTIIINKSQDSITGAPWGATNATVIWNG